MVKTIYEKLKKFFVKLGNLLIFLGAIGLLAAVYNWWNRPIVQAHINEFYPSIEIKNMALEKNIDKLDFFITALKPYGSLNIKVKNVGRSSAKDISFNLLPTKSKLGTPHIWKTNADCKVNVIPSTNLKMIFPQGTFVNVSPESIDPQKRGYFISIPRLRKNSEVEIKYTIYKESEEEPMFKFSKILCDNAKVKIFYYHQ